MHNGHVIAFYSYRHFVAWRHRRWLAVFFYADWHRQELKAAGLLQ